MASYMDRDNYGMYKDSEKHGPGPALMGADTLLGNDVVNGQDESLGDIKEFMIDMRSGNIAYAVLAFGGFLGMGEKLFAVPFQAFKLDTENHRFVLNVDKADLKHAPGFNKDAWPDMADVAWAKDIHSFYGIDPQTVRVPTRGPDAPAVRIGGGAGISTDPRAGTGVAGDDKDLSRIRGSNIG